MGRIIEPIKKLEKREKEEREKFMSLFDKEIHSCAIVRILNGFFVVYYTKSDEILQEIYFENLNDIFSNIKNKFERKC